MAGGAAESGRSVASRVTAILMTFRSGGTHTLSELAALAGLPISTTHRLGGGMGSPRGGGGPRGGGRWRGGAAGQVRGRAAPPPTPPPCPRGRAHPPPPG